MTSSKALLCFSLSFIFGVFVSSFLNIPELLIYEFFVLGILFSLIFLKEKTIIIFGICLLIFGLGIFKTEIAKPAAIGAPAYEKPSLLKQNLREIISQNFSPPHSLILAALTLGDDRQMSQEWKQKLNITGLRHITAISGSHIIILAGILTWFFIILGFHRGQAFYPVLIFICFFVFFTGLQSSAIRAGIMGSVFLLAQKIGRQKASLRTLILAAALMLGFDPLLLRHNIGFQLSFLAVLGLIYLMPFFENLFEKIKFFKPLGLSYLLAMTFSAQVFTAPISIYNFGYLSLAAPITNILIGPLIPFLMTVAFLFLFFSSFYQPLGWLISLPVYLMLDYWIWVVNFFSCLSITYINLEISWICVPISYLFLGLFIYFLSKKRWVI